MLAKAFSAHEQSAEAFAIVHAASAAEFPKHPPELMEGLRRYFKWENEKAVRPLIHEGNWQQAAEKSKPFFGER